MQIREMIEKNGWNKVVAFQTRNPMHRAHEALVKIAMERVGADGAVIHMLLGKLKTGDIPADVRDAAIRKMVELYFEPNTCEITGYGFDMLYAGPREAVLHAMFRQNMGATHLIVGRDHAGVGDYYGPFDAQTIFQKEVPTGALELQDLRGRPHRLLQGGGRRDHDARGAGRTQEGGLRVPVRHEGPRDAVRRRGPAARVRAARGGQDPDGLLPVAAGGLISTEDACHGPDHRHPERRPGVRASACAGMR